MKEYRILSPSGIVGYGFPEESFRAGVALKPDLIACDGGSTDPGPYYLGSGIPFTNATAVKRDMTLMLKAACELGIPLVIGTAGGSGADVHVNREVEIGRQIAKEEKLSFKMAVISSEFEKDMLIEQLRAGKIEKLGPAPEVTEDDIRSSTHIVAQMGIDPKARNVLLAHQFVTGSLTCESEEISVGGTDNVDAAVFADFDYVALGHIHGPQNIGSPRIRYCGTPLKYSFSEAKHQKSITVAELGEKGSLLLRTLPLIPRHDLREIRGSYEEVTAKRFYENTPVEDYLHITLTDEEDVPEAVARLRVIYPNLMKLTYDNTRTRSSGLVDAAADVQKKSPLTLFGELYEQQNGQPLSEIQQSYLQELIEAIWEEKQ